MSIDPYRPTTGKEFLLWATDEERLAVRVVTLFLELAALVARDAGLDHFTFRFPKLHEQFPDFARLHWPDQPWATSIGGRCPAVSLYIRSDGLGDVDRLAHIEYLHHLPEPPLPEHVHIKTRAMVAIAIPDRQVDYEHLLFQVKITLGNMLNKTL